jgi:prepilin-type N-terminal cleavage/methylation domain-containing protein
MRFYRCQKGFTLIELITTLILVGFIGAFASFFLFTGIRGFLVSRFSSETALKAQIALDRISAELRHINSLVNPPSATSVEYKSLDLTGTRRISYNSVAREIMLSVNGTPNVLLDNVSAFTLSWAARDMDQSADGVNEVSELRVAFTVRSASTENETPFSTRIYPRGMLTAPP